MEPDHRLIAERIKKISELRELGANPYPYEFRVTHHAATILEENKNLKKETKTKKKVSVAGRVTNLRRMGKASFSHIMDSTGRIQVYVRQDDVGEKAYSIWKKVDLGDYIGVEGTVFTTKTGEISVYASSVTILCKSIRPLPEKFHGIKDTEMRYRKRYLDLIMNPEIRETFRIRSRIIQSMRRTLDGKGFLEVETPVLQPIYGGANAKPFVTKHNALDMTLYLRISNELYLKRLLVGGFERVYEFVKDFRNEGIDRTHNPEFTQVEWYQAYGDYEEGMRNFEDVVSNATKDVLGRTKIKYQGTEIELKSPWKRLKVTDAIKKYTELDVLGMSREDLLDYCDKNGIEYEQSNWGMLVMAIFEAKCEEHLIQPTFIMDYPVESTPLAKPHRGGDERFVERFEAYINGWEVGNAYSELNDPILQRKFLEEQAELGRGGDEEAHPMDEDFLESIEQGMPPTSGVGLGVDRIVMLLTDSATIRDVILFPTMRKK